MTECLTSENLTKTVDGLSKVLSDTQATWFSHILNPSKIQLSSFNNNIIIGRFYCTFHKHANSEVQKPTNNCVFSLLSIIWMDLLGLTKVYFNGFKRSRFVICDWWISIRFVCFCVSRFVACDRNYDWRQRKTQLWRWLLNFRVSHVCEKCSKS